MGTKSLVRAGLPYREHRVPWGTTSLDSSLPKGTAEENTLGFPSEGWQPLAHNATDMLDPG